MIRCGNGALYTGITTDVERRLAKHQAQSKKCAKYLLGKSPLELVLSIKIGDKSKALREEMSIKSLPKHEKEEMIKMSPLVDHSPR